MWQVWVCVCTCVHKHVSCSVTESYGISKVKPMGLHVQPRDHMWNSLGSHVKPIGIICENILHVKYIKKSSIRPHWLLYKNTHFDFIHWLWWHWIILYGLNVFWFLLQCPLAGLPEPSVMYRVCWCSWLYLLLKKHLQQLTVPNTNSETNCSQFDNRKFSREVVYRV